MVQKWYERKWQAESKVLTFAKIQTSVVCRWRESIRMKPTKESIAGAEGENRPSGARFATNLLPSLTATKTKWHSTKWADGLSRRGISPSTFFPIPVSVQMNRWGRTRDLCCDSESEPRTLMAIRDNGRHPQGLHDPTSHRWIASTSRRPCLARHHDSRPESEPPRPGNALKLDVHSELGEFSPVRSLRAGTYVRAKKLRIAFATFGLSTWRSW